MKTTTFKPNLYFYHWIPLRCIVMAITPDAERVIDRKYFPNAFLAYSNFSAHSGERDLVIAWLVMIGMGHSAFI